MSTRFLPSKSILDHFRKLSSNNAEERVTAATAIVIETSEPGADHTQTIQYVLARLTKGLASGSDSSRLGFGIAYAEFLKQALGGGSLSGAGVTLQDVLQLLIEHTTAPSGTTGQEDRDFAFGRLFGIKAVLESGAVLSSATNTASYWPGILDLLFELAIKKSWLRETCAFTISRTIIEAEATGTEFLDLTWKKLSESGLENTSEGIAIKLALFKAAADSDGKQAIAFADERFPLDKGHLKTLAKLLKESSSNENGSKAAAPQKGNWNAKLPFVWDNIIKLYMSGNLEEITNNKAELAIFSDFWKIVVDESLFAANSSDERKFWGFQVFGKALDAAGENIEAVKTVFSSNFMKCLINQLSNPERYLHKAAQKGVRTIQSVAEGRVTLVPVIVEQLLLHNGTTNFDMITKTKTVEKLIPFANEHGLQKLVELFRTIITNTGVSDPKQVERRRQWAADQLLGLVRHKKIAKKDSWLEPIVDLFTTFGHFRRSDESTAQKMSATSHSMFRTRLMSCLAALMENKEKESNGSKWASHAVKTIGELEKDSSYIFAIEIDSEIKDAKKTAVKKLQKIKKQRKSASRMKKAQLEAFELLYAMVILQVLNGDPDAINVLDELQMCFEKISSSSETKSTGTKHEHRSKRVKLDETEVEDGDSETDVSQVLTEILLSFVSRQSVLLRRLAKTVFTAFVGAMTEPSLNLMFDVLTTKESMEGQNALFDEDASVDEVDGDSDGSDSDEMDSDVEVVEVNGNHDESDEESGSEAEADDEETEGMDDEAAAKLDADLAALLGVPRPDGSAMEIDGGDDEDMDDDEMLKMDEKIAEVFRQRNKVNSKSKKKQRMEAKETVINFKNRVLELLEVYVKHQFANELSLSVLLPLLVLMRQTTSKVVANNAHGVIKALVMASKGKGGGGNNKEKEDDKDTAPKPAELPTASDPKGLLQYLLKEIHNEAGMGRTKEHSTACSQCSLYVVKVLVHTNDKYLEKAFKLYAESMSRWMRDEKFNVQQTLFSDLVTWAGSVRKQFCTK